MGSGTRLSGFESWFYSILPVWTQAIYLIFCELVCELYSYLYNRNNTHLPELLWGLDDWMHE